MIRHRRKMLPILLLIKVGIRKRIRLYGNSYKDRERKYVRDTTNCVFAGCLRPILRERAKQTLLSFLQENAWRGFMLAKHQKFLQRIILFQRTVSLRIKIKKATPLVWQTK